MLPSLTKEQRQQNLAKGVQVRQRRAEYREQLKKGALPLEKLFALADEGDQAAAGMRASHLISSLPGYGSARTGKLMEDLHIAASRKVRGLGDRQRENILSAIKGRRA